MNFNLREALEAAKLWSAIALWIIVVTLALSVGAIATTPM
jgi:hypothetical protein